MRIGIDCRLWNETGVGRYIRNLVEELNKIDSKNEYILFVLAADKSQVTSHKLQDNFTLIIADIRWHSIEEQLLFPQIIREYAVDLMHFPYFSVPITYNQPFVVTIHDLILQHFSTGKASTLPFFLYHAKRIGYTYVINHAIKKSKKIIVPLSAVKQDVIKQFHVEKEKIAVTKEGAVEKNNQLPHIPYPINYKPYFLHVGNVYPHKNCERLVDAFSLIIKENEEQKLVFIGKEDYFMQRLKKYVAEKKLEKYIIFTGKVSDDTLFAYYANATALVIPSFMEGFGLPALEAMSQKCLVLASDISSLREVCDEVSLFFDPKNSEDIAKVMRKAIQLPTKERKDLQELGLQQCKQFSWQQMAKETLAIYESCAGV